MNYDVIVIGSGFGGAITSCRLAEAGYKVLILERGRRWDKTTYPRELEDPWIWNHKRPLRIPKGCVLPDDMEMPLPRSMCWDREHVHAKNLICFESSEVVSAAEPS